MRPIHKVLFAFLLFALATLGGAQHARASYDDYPVVKLQSLDKITARTMVFEARVGSTVKFGPLYIKVQACRKTPPIGTPEATAFLQIWEVDTKENSKWIFSGWMFASSPALSSMAHPVFDVWVIDCLEYKTGEEPPPPEEPVVETTPDAAAPVTPSEESAPAPEPANSETPAPLPEEEPLD